jgi:23S rRNA pseudouridine1911/1915/1917 synthase
MDEPQQTGGAAPEAEEDYPSELTVAPEQGGMRLDQFLAAHLPDVSRVRVRQLLEQQQILLNGQLAKPSRRLKGGERLAILGRVQPEPLQAIAENIPLVVVYEDRDLAVIDKPAGMRVHAGDGSSEDARNRGTLVNALLHRFRALSQTGGELRPGIVHRLDKDTSGLIVVAKNDSTHRKLAAQFSGRQVHKRYLALVHGWPKQDSGTVRAAIGRDRVRRTRMTIRTAGGREAISHFQVQERILSPYGHFALLEVKIDTGRTHQIRVHLSSIGHPVVGDTLYGAARLLSPQTLAREAAGHPISMRTESRKLRARSSKAPVLAADSSPKPADRTLSLSRNFLHAAALEFTHPRSGKPLRLTSPLPEELQQFLLRLRRHG